MGFKVPLQAYTKQTLMDLANPSAPGQLEALPWVLFDTQTYVDNTTTRLTFFGAVQNDKSLGNMESGGQLPDPQWFRVYYLGLDVLRPPTTSSGGITGVFDDIQMLVLSGRGIFTMNMSNKRYGPFPLSFLHQSGGATGMTAGTWTAEENITFANNSVPDGGFCISGALILPPKVGFDVTLEWPAVNNLTADALLRVWMAGVLFRRVL